MPPVVGVDLGGTSIRLILLDEAGQIVKRALHPTMPRGGPEAVISSIEAGIRELTSHRAELCVGGVGVAAAGQIHPDTGAVVYSPNLGWRDVPIRARLEAALGVPVWVENDVRGAAWGEFRQGAGRGCRNLVAVFVGTGIGIGVIIEGRLLRGAGNVAGEIGHTVIQPDGIPCVCGNRGCLETYASGAGFVHRLERAIAEGKPTALIQETGGDPSRLTAAQVEEAARRGDGVARAIWEEGTQLLGVALGNVVTLFNPERLILGGGVVESCPTLLPEVGASLHRTEAMLARQRVEIRQGELGTWAGAMGVGLLAREGCGGNG